VANRVTDVCGESIIHGSLRKYQDKGQDVSLCALVNIKLFDFNKRYCFLYFRFGVSSLSSPSRPHPPNILCDEEDHKKGRVQQTDVQLTRFKNNDSELLAYVHPPLRLQQTVGLPKDYFHLRLYIKLPVIISASCCNLGWKPKEANIANSRENLKGQEWVWVKTVCGK